MLVDADIRVDTRLKRAAESGAFPRELIVCGPAGTGKTYSLLRFFHCLAADYPGLRILWCRQTRVSLSESVLVTFEEEILPSDGMEQLASGPTRRGRHQYRYPHRDGRYSVIVLGGLDRPGKVMSTAWDVIYLNEAIEAKEEAWDALGSRLNRPGRKPWLGWLLGDTNPGVPAHWIKRRAQEGRLTLWDTTHKANPALWANGDWTAAGKLYRARLDTLRGAARARLLDGQWAANEGLVFADVLGCVVDDVPEYVRSGRSVGGIDFGWSHPFAALRGYLHDDVLWVTWERYQSFATLPTHSEALPRERTEWWADPSRPESIAELQIAGHHVNGAVHYGKSPVQEGIDQVCHRARTGRLRISRACVNLIRECGSYTYGPVGLPQKIDDHAPDALRYLVRGIDRGRVVSLTKVPKRPTDEDDPRWWGGQ